MSTTGTPRDVKILHLILASMGVTAYQNTVPLQLMDFAHRYTVGILGDAVAYNDYAHASGATLPAGIGASNVPVTVEDVRLAISLRVNQQFKPAAPKEVLLELAQERNARPLPPVPSGHGLRLPPEKHCLTGRNRSFDDDDDIIITGTVPIDLEAIAAANTRATAEMKDLNPALEPQEDIELNDETPSESEAAVEEADGNGAGNGANNGTGDVDGVAAGSGTTPAETTTTSEGVKTEAEEKVAPKEEATVNIADRMDED